MNKTTRYLGLALLVVTILVLGLSLTLYTQTRNNAFAVLAAQGENLAQSIVGSTLFGMASLDFQQDLLKDRLFAEGGRLSEKIQKNPGDAEELVRDMGRRMDLEAVLLFDNHAQLSASYTSQESRNPNAPRSGGRGKGRHGLGIGASGPWCEAHEPGPEMRREILLRFLESGETKTVLTPRGFSSCRTPFRVTVAMKIPDMGLLLLSGRPRPPKAEAPDLATLFETLALSPDILFVALQDSEGSVLARAGEAAEKDLTQKSVSRQAGYIRIVREFTTGSGEDARLILGVSTRKTEDTLAQARKNIMAFAGVAWLMGLLGMLVVFGLARSSERRVAALEEQAARAERLASLGRMAATVAHEVRNPLSAISVAVGRLNREISSRQGLEPPQDRLISLIREEIGRLNGIVEGFLALARAGVLNREQTDLAAVASSVCALYENEAALKGVTLSVKGEQSGCPAFVDREKVRQALGNLVKNAVQASPEGGRVVVFGTWTDKACTITVEDQGPGIGEADMPRIFEPFYTTRARGSGLGLAMAAAVAKEHGGELHAENLPRGGARFALRLAR